MASLNKSIYQLGGESLYDAIKVIKEGKPAQRSRSRIQVGNEPRPNNLADMVYEYPDSTINRGTSVGADIFDRVSFEGPNPFGKAEQGEQAAQQSFNLAQRVIINYKNYVQSAVHGGAKGQVSNNSIFYNKIVPPSNRQGAETFFNPSIDSIVYQLGQRVEESQLAVGTKTTRKGASRATKISHNDFLFCKKLGTAPNNRLVIVRRFTNPVPDDLIDSKRGDVDQFPIAVMITWFDKFPMSLNFQEKYVAHENGGILETLGEMYSGYGISGVFERIRSLVGLESKTSTTNQNTGSALSSPWAQSVWYTILSNLYESQGLSSVYQNQIPTANPNLIREAVIRSGLQSTIKFDLSFEYVMRQVGDLDPHIAMHALIANAVRMGTSSSLTLIPNQDTESSLSKGVQAVAEGRISEAMGTLISEAGDIWKKIEQGVADLRSQGKNTTTRTIDGKEIQSFTKNFSATLLSLYRYELMAALRVDTGLPSGSWHVTVGNPLDPIVSVGDLVPDQPISISFNDELSYRDFPTEMKVTMSLVSARNRGAQEIEQIFNAGRGRIYVYPSDVLDDAIFPDEHQTYKDPLRSTYWLEQQQDGSFNPMGLAPEDNNKQNNSG